MGCATVDPNFHLGDTPSGRVAVLSGLPRDSNPTQQDYHLLHGREVLRGFRSCRALFAEPPSMLRNQCFVVLLKNALQAGEPETRTTLTSSHCWAPSWLA